MNIEHISVSRSKSFQKCPYYYKLKYHEKIPNPGEEQFYFVYGKIIHKIAEAIIEEGGKRPIGLICEDVLKGRIEIEEGKKAPILPVEYKKRVPIHIKNLTKLNESIGYKGITEHKFKYDLEPPMQKLVTGFIDRVIINDNKAWIIDYKTTKKGPYRETKNSIKYDPQLRMYCRVIQKEFGIEPENIKAALYYLEDGLVLSASYTLESLLLVEKELLEVYDEIKQQDPDNVMGKTGRHCSLCEYKGICPFVRNKGKSVNWDGDLKSL